MTDFYLESESYNLALSSWINSFNELSDDSHEYDDDASLSRNVEDIFNNNQFRSYSNIFSEEIIWIASQARIRTDPNIKKCVRVFFEKINSIEDQQNYQKHLNTLIAITIIKIKTYRPNIYPCIKSCLTDNEISQIEQKFNDLEQDNDLNERALDINASQQAKLIQKYKAPSLIELSKKIEILVDIATTNSENSSIASAAINYLLSKKDVIDDRLGILGLVDDMYAIDYGISKIDPKNTINILINKHNLKYPSFDLPVIDSDRPLSLINVENLVKSSYTKIHDDRPLKRLIIVPNVGPLHILAALGKAICNRLDNSRDISSSTISFRQGDKILIGDIPASHYGQSYRKQIYVEFESPSNYGTDLFFVKTSSENSRITVRKEFIDNASLCLDPHQSLSKPRDVSILQQNESKLIPWGSIAFHKDIKRVNAEKKIFLFCKKNSLEKYINESIFGLKIKDWLGLRYFKKDFKHKDTISSHNLFPEPMIYATSNIEVAMEMINVRGKWDDDDVKREPEIVIINHPKWYKDDQFLLLLKKSKYDITVFNDFFRKSNQLIKEYGFEQMAIKPDSIIPIKDHSQISTSVIQKFLMKSQPFKIQTHDINNPVIDKITKIIGETKFENEHIFFKYKIQNFMKKIRCRITPYKEIETEILNNEINRIIQDLEFYKLINFQSYSKLHSTFVKNKKILQEFNRSEAIIDITNSLGETDKIKIVIDRLQISHAKEFFNFENRDINFILPVEIENQNNLDHIIIPFFHNTEVSSKLRNFKYANNHIFLMTSHEKNIHSRALTRETNEYQSLFSKNSKRKPLEKEDSVLLQDEIEKIESVIDPSANLFKHQISMVNTNYRSSNKDKNIVSKLFHLEDDQTYILPVGGEILVSDPLSDNQLPKLDKAKSVEINNRLIIPKSFSGGDLLEAILRNDPINEQLYIEKRSKADEWKKILNDLKKNDNMNTEDIRNQLIEIGIERGIGTIRSWLNDPDTVAPRDRFKEVPKIFSLTNNPKYNQESCLESITHIYSARKDAKELLNEEIKNTNIQNHQQTLEVSINEMNIDFNIYKVINIADVEVQFKHLYQVQSYEELLRITD